MLLLENVTHRNRNTLLSQNTGNKGPSVVIKKYPERQTYLSRPPVVLGTKLFSEYSASSFSASPSSKGQRNSVIFTDNIPKEIRIGELNSKTKMVSFNC